ARYAAATTASAPISTDVGFSQLENRSPAALPTGTRRDAIPPITVPSANGVISEETANSPSIRRVSRPARAPARSAYAAPRRTIPIPARNSGTDSVEAIEPNAVGYEVQNTVKTKISHTWLASHT